MENEKEKGMYYEYQKNMDYLEGLSDAYLHMRDYVHEIWSIGGDDYENFEERLLKELRRDRLPASVCMGIRDLFEEFVDEIWAHADEIAAESIDTQGDMITHMYEYEMNRRSTGTPCDYPDNDGHYSCPFDANGGDDCRNFCGLGVDE